MNEINIVLKPGLLITAVLYQGSLQIGSTINLVANVNEPSHYYGNIPNGIAAGEYLVIFKNGSNIAGSGTIFWTGSEEVSSVINKLSSMIENVSGQRFTSKALEQIPSLEVDVTSLIGEIERPSGLLKSAKDQAQIAAQNTQN